MQSIFAAYKHPFVLTFLGASLMVVYLPLSFVKDYICTCIVKHYPLWQTKSIEIVNLKSSCVSPRSPLKGNGTLKGSDPDLQYLIAKREGTYSLEEGISNFAESSSQITSWEIAKKSFSIAPLWFLTEVNTT